MHKPREGEREKESYNEFLILVTPNLLYRVFKIDCNNIKPYSSTFKNWLLKICFDSISVLTL